MKTSKEITTAFYQAMFKNQGWEDFLAAKATYLGPLASLIEGKEAVVDVTQQFLKNKHTEEVKTLLQKAMRLAYSPITNLAILQWHFWR
ncbi:MAG TPA: hypothetical protein DCS93_39865 [Microscillaceae bacterium]|nr:hypothetical protein [Microscillaceae bacterium]